jgi:HEAT repeat protein
MMMFFARTIASVICFIGFILATTRVGSAQDNNESPISESALLAVLQSDAPAADKAIACKQLAIHGTGAAAPALATLLTDPQLASWARIALEAIPGSDADAALRNAVESLDGLLLVGTINSIGVRRDAIAATTLASLLERDDPEVAAAAAVALGHIGTEAAEQSLIAALSTVPAEVRSAVAEGCVLCAEHRIAQNNPPAALTLYEAVRNADVTQPRILDATRGTILTGGSQGIALLRDLLQSPDLTFFRLALSVARELTHADTDAILAEELQRATPNRAALILLAMADRPDTVDRAAIVNAARRGPLEVRVAAISALAQVGDASCLDTLLQSGLEADLALAQAAKNTLAQLGADDVNEQIIHRLPKSNGTMKALLIEVIGQRRIADAVPDLVKALEEDEEAIRHASLVALGETVSQPQLDVLIAQLIQPSRSGDADAAARALKTASVRMPDREACAMQLADAYQGNLPLDKKQSILEILGAVGGSKALYTLAEAAKGTSDPLQDASTRLLGEWMTADAAPVLLELAKVAPGEKYQVRSLRGYIRIARQFTLPDEERAEMCRQALNTARNVAEKRLVLDVLKRYPHPSTLAVAVEAAEQPEVQNEAQQAALLILQKLGPPTDDLQAILKKIGMDRIELQIMKAQYGASNGQRDVTDTLKGLAGNLPLIALPSSSYNASFGGDPAPGQVKHLTIQYRVNGKPAEATFRENDLLILPVPQ